MVSGGALHCSNYANLERSTHPLVDIHLVLYLLHAVTMLHLLPTVSPLPFEIVAFKDTTPLAATDCS